MSIEAMKQALEALESATPKYTRQRADQKTLGGALDYWKLEQHQRLKAIASLRQAIAVAEQHKKHSATHGEPVAVMQLHTDGWDLIEGIDTDWLETLPFGTTLYTHSQPKREPLTDEQVRELFNEHSGYGRSNFLAFARSIEAAHGIKE